MERIISRAIDGGFEEGEVYFDSSNGMYMFRISASNKFHVKSLSDILMMPSFWKCLGLAEGWKFKAYKNGQWITEETDRRHMSDTPFRYPEWKWHWFACINLVAEGGDIESFFNKLII